MAGVLGDIVTTQRRPASLWKVGGAPVDLRRSVITVPEDEIERNVESIEAVPLAVLPAGPARDALLAIARRGRDCYAYASGGAELGTWCVWLEDLANARKPERNGRVQIAEWVTSWQALIAEAHLSVES